jgi:amino acid adenylation domain-containing protein
MVINVTEWLDETTEKFPDKIAISDENKQITFKKFRDSSISLAEKIIDFGAYKKPIAIVLRKSADTLIAFMGVAYSGNFYTVIDLDMPSTRKRKIFEVFQPEIVILSSEDELEDDFIVEKNIIYINGISDAYLSEEKVLKCRNGICDTDLLYTLFTSGSTGIPKGVTICHRSVIDYIEWVENTFCIDDRDVFGNQAPFYFDNSILDIYTSIKTGACLQIIPQQLFSQPVRLLSYLKDKKINTIFWVPSVLIMVANLHALKKVDLKHVLKRVLFCGEVMPTKQLNEWIKYLPEALYANLYGPTEITDACTYYVVNRVFADDEPLPIGIPMRNTDILVLNEKQELVKPGETGELCVRGTSLSMGYYNDPEKTKEVFVQNPLNKAYVEYIYRTGDLVKYNEYNELIYVSRKDYQIKHMGHRIELGEIETVVSGLPKVERCCCIYDDIKKRIVLILKGAALKVDVREVMKNLLPVYMIPGKIIIVDEMPLNTNGKIDRNKLKEIILG